ncbi:MAG: PHP domain-containing protein, partial [Planctomycetota bacterium]|nr:PHP domain-containing protein [Planctomycetota bacterium]
MKRFLADLHIHTVLSPCASEEMTPPAIVRAAVAKGLGMIAICDHNSAGNVRATQEAAGGRLSVLAGMEVTTAEEVHVLGLFPDAASAASAADEVLATLPDQPEPVDADHRQWLMDAEGRVT